VPVLFLGTLITGIPLRFVPDYEQMATRLARLPYSHAPYAYN